MSVDADLLKLSLSGRRALIRPACIGLDGLMFQVKVQWHITIISVQILLMEVEIL
jgi:hypothetical protein